MADISVTAANVAWVSGVPHQTVIAGETITPGQAVYRLSSDNEHYKTDADVDASSEFAGIALTSGYNGQPMVIAPPGAVINVGATLTAGTVYALSTTAGGIAPETDLLAGDYITVVYIGNGGTNHEVIGKKGTAVHA